MKKILFIEDAAIFREPIAAALRQQGFAISSAVNGKEGLVALARQKPDVILLDVAMPEMDGITFLKEFRKNPISDQIPVILLTAVAEKDYVVQAKELGVKEYLVKSYFSLDELRHCIDRVIEDQESATLSAR